MKKIITSLILSMIIGSIFFGILGMVNAETNCTVKEDCYPADFVPSDCGTFYSCINNKCAVGSNDCALLENVSAGECIEKNSSCCLGDVCNSAFPNCINGTNPVFDGCDENCTVKAKCIKDSCKNLYWIDNNNKSCGQKQFCGAYMYLGLQTFESKTQCEKAVNESKNCPEYSRPVCEDDETIISKDNNGCPKLKCRNKFCDEETPEGECYKNLSNGRKAEIKIMPETASETAIARLGELNFTIELKEVGKGTPGTDCIGKTDCLDNDRLVYELTGKKEGKFLGIFKIMASEKVQVDAETGVVVSVKKPWWAFLATRI